MTSSWVQSARALGLEPCYARASVLYADGWQDLRHFVSDPVTGKHIARFGDTLMAGQWQGTSVIVAESVIARTRRGERTRHLSQVFVPIEPALPLGLSVQPQGSSGGGAHLPDLVVGERAFDARYHVFAADVALVRPLFARTGQPSELVDFLTNLAREDVSVEIVDDRVRLYQEARVHDARTLGYWLDSAQFIAARLRATASSLPKTPTDERLLERLRELAKVLDLEVSEEQRAARGRVDDVEIWVHRSSRRGRQTTVVVGILPRAFIEGLRVVKHRAGLPTYPTRTGHSAIDATFEVRGSPQPVASAALAAVEDWLMPLAWNAEQLAIENHIVHAVLTGAPHELHQLENAVAQVVTVAKGLSRAPGAGHGPYR